MVARRDPPELPDKKFTLSPFLVPSPSSSRMASHAHSYIVGAGQPRPGDDEGAPALDPWVERGGADWLLACPHSLAPLIPTALNQSSSPANQPLTRVSHLLDSPQNATG